MMIALMTNLSPLKGLHFLSRKFQASNTKLAERKTQISANDVYKGCFV